MFIDEFCKQLLRVGIRYLDPLHLLLTPFTKLDGRMSGLFRVASEKNEKIFKPVMIFGSYVKADGAIIE